MDSEQKLELVRMAAMRTRTLVMAMIVSWYLLATDGLPVRTASVTTRTDPWHWHLLTEALVAVLLRRILTVTKGAQPGSRTAPGLPSRGALGM